MKDISILLGSVNNLNIRYLSVGQSAWVEQLPISGWVLLAIADNAAQVPDGAVAACLRHAPAGISCTGCWAAALEDIFDMDIVLQELDQEEQNQFPLDYAPVTTAIPGLKEALWFAATLAPDMAEEVIDTVVCLDFTRQQQAHICALIPLLAAGWLPPDTLI